MFTQIRCQGAKQFTPLNGMTIAEFFSSLNRDQHTYDIVREPCGSGKVKCGVYRRLYKGDFGQHDSRWNFWVK